MDHEELLWIDDTEIDCKLWLQALLGMTANKDGKEKLVRDIAQKTGQIPEHIERIIDATITFMAQKTLSI